MIVLVSAVLLLLWNGSSFFHNLRVAAQFDREIQLTGTALTLNVALILFGWRRYVDLHYEAERSAENEERAAVLASTDTVTGLFNRKGFADRAQLLADEAGQEGKRLVIVSVHIQRFKAVNDSHGFEVGDQLLRAIGSALTDDFGHKAVVARLSGDEFAAALAFKEGDFHVAEALAERALHSATKPFLFNERIIQVGAFCGIASAAPDTRIPDLLRRADIAMDRARSGRVARPVWFDSGMERALIAQSEIEQGLRYGLDHGQFEPVFEPQFDLATGEIVGFEVLARWSHPLSGTILPDVFIPIAEETGLIGRLSEQVIGQALRSASGWDQEIKISVNISPSQLTDSWLAQKIVKILSETGFPAERLVVEITESSLFSDIDLARSIVTSLKNQGIRVALDDFGTGFSSLSHLRSLPFDIIKIDRSFVSSLHEKRESMAIVRAVTTLAGALSVPVCIEGIENELAYKTVLKYGCAIGQGWYLGKPMSAECARELLIARVRHGDVARPFDSAANG
ncbi:MAG TPA: EAL domain-containing protein [Sphingomicrobium sp.]|nr:EAL domain-containing protein [Sphingomicrobium sp.]